MRVSYGCTQTVDGSESCWESGMITYPSTMLFIYEPQTLATP
jgi:hypothetical protein